VANELLGHSCVLDTDCRSVRVGYTIYCSRHSHLHSLLPSESMWHVRYCIPGPTLTGASPSHAAVSHMMYALCVHLVTRWSLPGTWQTIRSAISEKTMLQTSWLYVL